MRTSDRPVSLLANRSSRSRKPGLGPRIKQCAELYQADPAAGGDWTRGDDPTAAIVVTACRWKRTEDQDRNQKLYDVAHEGLLLGNPARPIHPGSPSTSRWCGAPDAGGTATTRSGCWRPVGAARRAKPMRRIHSSLSRGERTGRMRRAIRWYCRSDFKRDSKDFIAGEERRALPQLAPPPEWACTEGYRRPRTQNYELKTCAGRSG